MRADGSEQRPLTDNRWEEGTPAWVPAAPAGGDGADFRRRFRDEFRGHRHRPDRGRAAWQRARHLPRSRVRGRR